MPLLPTLRHSLLIAGILTLAACGQQQPHGAMMGFPPAEVTTLVVQPASFPVVFEYVGQTAGSKDVEVRARVTGIVEKRLYQEGAPVRAGQPLFLLDARPFEAQLASAEAEVARAQAQKAQTDREAARLKPLAERKAIGQKEADDAASAAELAAATVKATQAKLAEARLNLAYTRVNAPISGLSSRALQSEGSLANANTTLLTTVSQVDPIWVLFNVSEGEQLRLNRAMAEGRLALPANNAFDVTIRLSDGSTFPRSGKINFADTRVNPATGTYEMRAELANGDLALKPGQFVRVALKGAQRKDALAVPQVAVLDGPQGKFVYVAGKDKDGKDVASVRPVVVGDWIADSGSNLWVIESGLKPGEQVIVDGVAKLMPGAPIKLATSGAPAPDAKGAAHPPRRRRNKRGQPPCSPASSSTVRSSLRSSRCSSCSRGWPRCARCPSRSIRRSRRRSSRCRRSTPAPRREVLEQTVAAPLENAINGVPGMIYMSSSNSASNGIVQIQVTFEIGTNVDIAAVNVNNRVKQVEPRLPLEVRRQGVTVEPRLVGVPAGARVLFARRPLRRPVHVELRDAERARPAEAPARHDQRADLRRQGLRDAHLGQARPPCAAEAHAAATSSLAINEQNAQFAAGKVGQSPVAQGAGPRLHDHLQGRLERPKEFEQIIVRANPDGSAVRLSDVARIELGSRDYEFMGRYNGKPATLVGIFLAPGANALEVAKTVTRTDRRARDTLSGGPRLRGTVRHDALRAKCRSARC